MSQLLLSTLGVVCPHCDEYNPPKAAKCSACGTGLLGEARPPAGPAARAPTQPQAPAAPPLGGSGSGPKPSPTRGHMEVGKLPQSILDKARPAQPPGLKPSAKPAPGPAPAPGPSEPAPIPASELVRKQPAGRFGLAVIAGSGKGQRFRLAAASCQIGRSRGAIMFSDDPFISPVHASLMVRDNVLVVRDEGSASGVYVAISGQEQIAPNTFFAAGHRLFRFTGALRQPPPQPGAPIIYGAPIPSGNVIYGVEEILVGGRPGRGVVTASPLFTIGQSLCDLSFPKDEGLATRHCELAPTPTGAMLRDLSGGLGTYVRVLERPLNFGDRIRIGEQVLQVEA